MIPQHTINYIREAANDNIVDLIGEHVQLKRAGSSMKGKCPFHDENTPSFSVSEQKGIYKCFGCGEGGDAVDFLIKRTGHEFIEVIRDLAERYHIQIEEEKTVKHQSKEQIPSFIDKATRAKIRKSGYALLFFSEKELNQFLDKDDQPCLQVSWPLKAFEAKSIKKYAPVVFFRTDMARANNSKFWESIRAFLDQDTETGEQLEIYMLTDDAAPQVDKKSHGSIDYTYNDAWYDYMLRVLPKNQLTRQEMVKTIACIHDNISRQVHTRYFIDEWNRLTNIHYSA
ncbi:CHC2 zinc finger domain-containing protein [Gracilimonas sediminicola]|uniref:CHC2 zinc finger domain-containing protein n=1 Tax=Gracilimonas sediminicola TaxID=2952158 RepID=UPI0038D3FE70